MAMFTSCSNPHPWSEEFQQKLPLLGHRNWIVITDMAYPLQSGQGITTIYADQSYLEVLKEVKEKIDASPHVFAHIWRDCEFDYISEDLVSGIGKLKEDIQEICGKDAQSVEHEQLIKRLDEAGRLYQILVIKTPMTVPYTTTFFELDCAYWDAERAQKLDKLMKGE